MPTIIIIYTASGRATDYALETSPTAPAQRAQPENYIVGENSLVSHLQEDNPQFTFEDHHLQAVPECMCKHNHKASTDSVWRSDPGSTAISFHAAPQISSVDSLGHTASEKRPAAVTPAPINSGTSENVTLYSTSSYDLELGTGVKGKGQITPTNARIQRTPSMLEGYGFTSNSAGFLEGRTGKWNGSNCSGGTISVSAVAAPSAPFHSRSASSAVTHPIPAAIPLASLAPNATTFDAYVAD